MSIETLDAPRPTTSNPGTRKIKENRVNTKVLEIPRSTISNPGTRKTVGNTTSTKTLERVDRLSNQHIQYGKPKSRLAPDNANHAKTEPKATPSSQPKAHEEDCYCAAILLGFLGVVGVTGYLCVQFVF